MAEGVDSITVMYKTCTLLRCGSEQLVSITGFYMTALTTVALTVPKPVVSNISSYEGRCFRLASH